MIAWLLLTACSGEPPLTIAGASSLREVLPQLVAVHTERTGEPVRVTYGGSGTLAAQVRAGAPVDVVVFAGQAPVEGLVTEGLLHGTPQVVATNTLVLVGADNDLRVGFRELHQLSYIAIADPQVAPVGAYARQVLRTYGHWDEIAAKAVAVPDVAASLALVRRGEVQAAVVYRTDARLAPELSIWDEAVLDAAHSPVVIASAVQAGPCAFLQTLTSDAGRAVWTSNGFTVPPL
ncbi:MAG: molybdate transport system substrate-binding protein [Myxococcota bacterium]